MAPLLTQWPVSPTLPQVAPAASATAKADIAKADTTKASAAAVKSEWRQRVLRARPPSIARAPSTWPACTHVHTHTHTAAATATATATVARAEDAAPKKPEHAMSKQGGEGGAVAKPATKKKAPAPAGATPGGAKARGGGGGCGKEDKRPHAPSAYVLFCGATRGQLKGATAGVQ